MKIYLSFSLSITDVKSLCHESSRELEKPEMPKRGREKPWLGKTNSAARLFDSGSLFRFVSNTFQPGFFLTSTLWKIFILVSCNGSVLRFVPRWRLADNLPEAPVLHKALKAEQKQCRVFGGFLSLIVISYKTASGLREGGRVQGLKSYHLSPGRGLNELKTQSTVKLEMLDDLEVFFQT